MTRAAAVALATLLLSGCGPAAIRPYAGAGLRAAERKRLAIVPFENLSKAPGAGKTLEGMVLVEVLKRAPLAVADPGEVAAALSKERVRLATSMSREVLQAVARELGADLVLLGTLHEYDMQAATSAGAGGQVPVVSVTLRALDAASGEIVWAANASRRGTDSETVFGMGRVRTLHALAEQTAAELAAAFAASVGGRP